MEEQIINLERKEIEDKIRELAIMDFKYFNQYLTEEQKKKFVFTEEEKKKYGEIIVFLKSKKILVDKEEFFYCNGPDERIYYMTFEAEQKKEFNLTDED